MKFRLKSMPKSDIRVASLASKFYVAVRTHSERPVGIEHRFSGDVRPSAAKVLLVSSPHPVARFLAGGIWMSTDDDPMGALIRTAVTGINRDLINYAPL